MSDLRTAAQQALRDLEQMVAMCWSPQFTRREYDSDEPEENELRDKVLGSITDLKAALAQQEQEQADYPEEKLQAVAQYVSNQYHVWYGVAARDIEEVLRQSVSCGLVSNPPRREWQGLSMGEALTLWGMRSDGPSNGEIAGFARAIEQALKEKNQ